MTKARTLFVCFFAPLVAGVSLYFVGYRTSEREIRDAERQETSARVQQAVQRLSTTGRRGKPVLEKGVTLFSTGSKSLPADVAQALATLKIKRDPVVQIKNPQVSLGYALAGKGKILRAEFPRLMARQAESVLLRNFTLFGFSLLGVGLICFALLELRLMARLRLLLAQVEAVENERRPNARLKLTGKDELAQIAAGFNRILQVLESHTEQLQRKEQMLHHSTLDMESQIEDRVRQMAPLNAALEYAVEGIARVDPEGRFLQVNAAFAAMHGCRQEDMQGLRWVMFVSPDDVVRVQQAYNQMRTSGKGECEVQAMRRDGTMFYTEVVMVFARGEGGGHYRFIKDVTERKQLEAKVEYQAYHDALTGLPNRALFMEKMMQAQIKAQEFGRGLAVIFLDLDNFKIVNDSMGHEAGDQLLVTLAERLRQCVRPGDLVSRLGGDEFTVLMENINSEQDAVRIAERIVESLHEKVILVGQEFFPSGSVGIAFANDAAKTPDEILRDADTAMYQVKANGKSGYVVFDQSMSDKVVERIELENGLRQAMQNDEILLHYQPIVSLRSGRVVGAEALVRWKHPTKGMIPPVKFIPVAEESGLISQLGYYVLETACLEAKTWQPHVRSGNSLVINVNLSGKQLQQADVVDRVADVLNRTGIPPQMLKLEITESVLMSDINDIVGKLQMLKNLGIKLAIDDFGTGYSSMSSISTFPVDTIKIDKAFVSRLGQQSEASAIVGAIIMLSKTMKMDVVAEGIEINAQREHLKTLGCDMGQGYFFARPLPADEFLTHLRTSETEQQQSQRAYDKDALEQMLSRLAAQTHQKVA
jgi:diguanylate cyclase (GGDEF)-like protein/PAS domain S-box-containing protein